MKRADKLNCYDTCEYVSDGERPCTGMVAHTQGGCKERIEGNFHGRNVTVNPRWHDAPKNRLEVVGVIGIMAFVSNGMIDHLE